jgi:hypothetical protein
MEANTVLHIFKVQGLKQAQNRVPRESTSAIATWRELGDIKRKVDSRYGRLESGQWHLNEVPTLTAKLP